MCTSLLVVAACGGDKKAMPDAPPIDAPPPPAITSIAPNPLCSDGMTLTITGTNFQPGATVTLDGAPVTATVLDSMHISVTVPANTIVNGNNAIVVTNPGGETAMGTLTGEVKPLMFFVDPNVLSASMTARLTVYMSGLTTTVTGVSVQPHAGGAMTALTDIAAVANHANQVQATVTGGTLGADTYDVTITDGVCSATLPNGLTIVATPDITITAVKPPFGDPTKSTAISITTSGYALKQTPRVYLSSGGTATALSAVTWESATSVDAVVPANALPAGDYDVIVIDPLDSNGAHVGVLPAGFHLIANPPVIDSVTPTTVIATVTTPLAVAGSGFATGSTPKAYFTACSAPAGTALPAMPVALPAISGATANALNVTVNANTIPASAACVLRIVNGTPTNPLDPCPAGGTCLPYVDYSAIAFVSGSGNLGAWTPSTGSASDPVQQLPAARTRLGAVVGHVTSQARYLYQVGGDDGAVANASNAVVSAQLDPLGNVLAWSTQRSSMTSARTGAAVIRIGQFIYAIGGYDGTNTLKSVERARILDPLDVPALPSIDLTPSATGLAAGSWVYRISGVRAANDASNPGGETLASDPLDVTLPDLTAMTSTPAVKVTLTWPAMQNVVSYNIYRTATAGQDAGQVQLIANVPQPAGSTVTYDDTGATPTSQTPLPIGSTGNWSAIADLTTARFGATAQIAAGPSDATTTSVYLYVAGGGSDTTLATATLLDNYEFAKIDITNADGSQVVNAFAVARNAGNTADVSIGGARAFASSFSADHSTKSDIGADTTVVYFGSGLSKATTFSLVTAARAGEVKNTAATGDLAITTVNAPGTGGAASVTLTGYLFTLGGLNSGASLVNTLSTQLCPGGTGCTTGVPTLTTWSNGGGGTPTVPRVFSAAVVESPFIYLFGGSTNTTGTNATKSVERAVF
ncbi:MAG TPA: kelch repeat-containing protein [Kofleriaceae bacterium]|nr:kelch repeat-containing protein [Kofleriaceae bacterium]